MARRTNVWVRLPQVETGILLIMPFGVHYVPIVSGESLPIAGAFSHIAESALSERGGI